MKKIYLSLPISGYDLEERRSYSQIIQRELEKREYEVFNPLYNGLPKEATTNEHMRKDISKLCECDTIIMCQKWNHSAGCVQEFNVAVSIGCEIKFLLSAEPFIMVETKFD